MSPKFNINQLVYKHASNRSKWYSGYNMLCTFILLDSWSFWKVSKLCVCYYVCYWQSILYICVQQCEHTIIVRIILQSSSLSSTGHLFSRLLGDVNRNKFLRWAVPKMFCLWRVWPKKFSYECREILFAFRALIFLRSAPVYNNQHNF